ncbi:MAG: tetratricopeptide repeat protein [Planctomycetales bacterium]|nr:tetratricopeptide repeat protein [Planctomycetales bacterium]
MDIAQKMREAVGLHQAGDLASAGRLYADVLQAAPDTADAWHLSGVMALQLGRVQQAIEQIEFSLRLDPGLTSAWANLAAANLESGRGQLAERNCRVCLQRDPRHGQAHALLGNALRMQGRPREALAHYRTALEIQPRDATVWCNYGAGLDDCGRLEQAREANEEALRLAPGLTPAMVNLGAVWRQLGALDKASLQLEAALRLAPGSFAARLNLANVRRDQLRLEEAAELAEALVRGDAQHAGAWHLLGLVRHDLGQGRDALEALERAAQIAPERFVGSLLYATSLSPELSAKHVAATHFRWAAALPGPDHSWPIEACEPLDRDPDRTLVIGFLSGDFREHAVASFLSPVFDSLDRSQFRLHGFSEAARRDSTTESFRQRADQWTNTCGMSNEELASQVQAQGIDILVDVAGHTGRNRLAVMNWRPAPVQMSFLGYPNTTGLESVDYYVTDPFRDPPDEIPASLTNAGATGSDIGTPTIAVSPLYSEQLLRLPHGAICYQPPLAAPAVSPAPVLRRGGVTFGSLHRLDKLNDDVLALWMRVLAAAPGSRLLIVRDTLQSAAVRARLLQRLAAAASASGFDESRCELRGGWRETHLEHYADIDVLLPVFPWGGGTTTYEALWMGVPPMVVATGRPSSKAAAALLRRIRHADWVAHDEQDLLQRCRQWAADPSTLIAAREQWRPAMLRGACDSRQFGEELGAAFRLAWRRWCNTSRDAVSGDLCETRLDTRASIAGDPCEARLDERASIAGDPCEARLDERASIAGDPCEARLDPRSVERAG